MCVFVCELHGLILLAAGSSCPRQFTKDCASSSVKDNSNVFICINFRSLYSALLNWILFLNCQISWTKVSLFLFNFMLFILRILPFLYKLRNKYDDRPKSNSLTSDFYWFIDSTDKVKNWHQGPQFFCSLTWCLSSYIWSFCHFLNQFCRFFLHEKIVCILLHLN